MRLRKVKPWKVQMSYHRWIQSPLKRREPCEQDVSEWGWRPSCRSRWLPGEGASGRLPLQEDAVSEEDAPWGQPPLGGHRAPRPGGARDNGRKGALLHPEEAPQAGPQQATGGFRSPQPSTGALIHAPAPSSALRLPEHRPLGHQPGGSLSPCSCLICPQAVGVGTRPQRPPRGVHAWSLLWGLELASLQPLCAVHRRGGQTERTAKERPVQG